MRWLDQPAVLFELRFAGAAHADAAACTRDRWVHICSQPRQRVFELGQLDLQARLVRAGAGGEDVEDQLAAVEDLQRRGFFARPLTRLLTRRRPPARLGPVS